MLAMAFTANAAEPARFAFAGVWDRAEPTLRDAGDAVHAPAGFFKDADLASNPARQAEAEGMPVLFVLNLSPESIPGIVHWLESAKKRHPELKVLSLDQRGSHAELIKAGLLQNDEKIWTYWRANGAANLKRLLVYTSVTYLGAKGEIEPPLMIPDFGYYEPGREESFETFAALRAYKTAQGHWKDGAPLAALLIQQSFWVTHDTRVVDAEVRALENHGVNAAVIFGDRQEQNERLIAETHPDLLIEDRHGAMWNSRDVLQQFDVPYLRPVSMLGYTLDEWRKDPRGMSQRDVGMFLTLQESWGTIEPVLVGGMQVNIAGFRLHEPEPGGVDRFAGRAAAWLNLRRKTNAQKKIAIIYYNKGLGKDDLMRGSPTGAFLDGPESLVRFLPAMKQAGFTLDRTPASADQLIDWIRTRARNVGPWNRGDLARMVDQGKPALVPLSLYKKWFATKLSAQNQAAVIKHFGPPPGNLMTIQRGGQQYLVVPKIELGNVILAPQPERGQEQDDKLLHSRDVPPPHNYLAFYWWLQEEFHADAIVHWGTHGSLELLPGKEAGPSREDWGDICAGNMPVVDLWIMDNLAEATMARRRSYAQLVDHMVPPAVGAGVDDKYVTLRDDVEKLAMLEPGLLKEQYRKRITDAARKEKLDELLRLRRETQLSDDSIRKLGNYLHELQESRTPLTLHVLGQPPEEKYRWEYLVEIGGRKFLEHLAPALNVPNGMTDEQRRLWLKEHAAKYLQEHLATADAKGDLGKDLDFLRDMDKKLHQSGNEITGLVRALEGRYIEPGPGPEPIRNPASIPGGRNLYSLNPEEIPTRPAWEVGMQLVDELLRKHPVHKVGLDLNGMDTMRDFGVMESQVLYLMGVRPVWDRNGLAIDVELIPRAELKRPRVDVFCAMGGLYKENFGTRVNLMDKAVRLVSAVKEDDNYVRQGTLATEDRLRKRGYSEADAANLAEARIFGTKPGNMSGTNILYMVPRSGVWDKDSEVSDVYIDNMSYAYTGDVWGQKIDGLYQEAIQGTDILVRVWASNMTSQLSNHHAYEYLGGLSMAVKKLTGKEPEAFIADVRDPNAARMRDFTEVMATTYSSELLNKKWVEGMQSHGYAGAGHVAELVKNTFGWSVTRDDAVSNETWNEIYSVYVEDKYHLGVTKWLEDTNPHARQEMAATMLEASRKGYWKADAATVANLSRIYAESVVAHGDSGGLVSGGNKRLEQFVSAKLNAPGSVDAGLAARMSQALAVAQQPPAAPAPPSNSAAAPTAPGVVSGVRLRLAHPPRPQDVLPRLWLFSLAGCALILISCGYFRRLGAL